MPYRALVVEDDPSIRKLVEKLLARRMAAVDTVADGRTALEKLRVQRYSVVVLDLMVPEIDGFQLIEYVKREHPGTPVAVVSALSGKSLTNLDPDVVKLIIAKPFDVDEFTNAIFALIEKAEG